MAMFSVRLFGKIQIQLDGEVLAGLDSRRVQELFCYLLLYRDRPHHRETLASLFWSDNPTTQSKKYLRQALWQLQSALDCQTEPISGRVLLVEPEWVRFNPAAPLWLDVVVFEQIFNRVQGVPGRALDTLRVQALRDAVDLYRGDLLEGWFQDWCLYQRERLQNMYLAMLDKLIGYCEAAGEYEAGLAYGTRILFYDQARERTHRRLMRLYDLAGDRTTALRQYDRCVEALRRELSVRPAARTVTLYEQIRAERLADRAQSPASGIVASVCTTPSWSDMLHHLKQLQTALTQAQRQLQYNIQVVELAMNDQD